MKIIRKFRPIQKKTGREEKKNQGGDDILKDHPLENGPNPQ